MRRACGPCRACCSGPEIGALDKPRFETCANACERGCRIYDARPESCRRYECMWLSHPALLRDDERPDRLGVYFALSPAKFAVTGEVVSFTVDAWESEPHAIDSDLAGAALGRVGEHLARTLDAFEGVEVVRFGDPIFYWRSHDGGTSLEERRRDLLGERVEPFHIRPKRP